MSENLFSNLFARWKSYAVSLKEKSVHLRRPFFILLIIYGVAAYPIIRANFNYIDDMGRIYFGYMGWRSFSRYLSCLLSVFIHGDVYLTDVSPIPQLLAVFLCALSGIALLHLFNDNKKITFLNVVAVVPLGLSPYFLECMSYKFDAPYMALSILASVFPFLFYGENRKNKYRFCALTVFGTIVMCTTYQAASGIIPMVALFLAYRFWSRHKGREAIKLLVTAAGSYLIGLLIFRIFIMRPVDSYVSNSMYSLKELPLGFWNHLKTYYANVWNDFNGIWKIFLALIILCFVIGSVRESRRHKLASFVMTMFLLAVSGIFVFGLYPALTNPLFEPRAMYGFGIFIALICVCATGGKHAGFVKIISFALAWCLFIFSCTYGNALYEQKRYIDFRVQAVVDGLNELEVMQTDTVKKVRIHGSAGRSPVVDNMIENSLNGVLLDRLVQTTFDGDWEWDYIYFANYFKIKNIEMATVDEVGQEELEVVKDTMYFSIATNQTDYILITLK